MGESDPRSKDCGEIKKKNVVYGSIASYRIRLAVLYTYPTYTKNLSPPRIIPTENPGGVYQVKPEEHTQVTPGLEGR